MSNQSPLIENVSDTAFWVAYYRALESERPDALFHDPYARILAGEQGEKITKNIKRGTTHSWALVVRTKVIDEIILKLVGQNACDAVINLAAGLDTRPYRLPLPSSLRWIEVDFPGIISYKKEKLAGEQPRCLLEQIPLDLADIAARHEFLQCVNNEAQCVLVITEGLLIYLSQEQVESLAHDLYAQPHIHWWLTEFISKRVQQYIKQSWDEQLNQDAVRLQFAVDDSEAFYLQRGWKLTEFYSALEESYRLRRTMPFSGVFRFLSLLMPKDRREYYRKMSGYALLERSVEKNASPIKRADSTRF